MSDLAIDRRPDLHDPIAVEAFSGWNDAASAATDAARFLVRRLGARKFASIDAERYYDFREVRPTVAIGPAGGRELNWPQNEFYYARNPTGPHDLVVGVGVEPNLCWRSFSEAHMELYRTAGVSMVVSLGALLADVPHTRPTRVTGTALDPDVAAQLDLSTSRYEGPTGIVGVLHNVLRAEGVAAASLWANVPHYITTSQNPRATAALLLRLQELLGMAFDLRELDAAGERFVTEVDTALAANSEIAEYVRRLEEAADTTQDEDPRPGRFGATGDDLLLDIEDYLRQQRDDEQ